MTRRNFITLLGCAGAASVVAPRIVNAQRPAMPVVGFLHPASLDAYVDRLRAFHIGLKETGYVDGENVTVIYRWAENQYDRLPGFAVDLVRRKVDVIAAAGGGPSAMAAKAATTTIPIAFAASEDPVKLGLVASLARPGGNLTGLNFFVGELVTKRLELLRELVPRATRVAVLVNPTNTTNTESTLKDAQAAARIMGLQVEVLRASNNREIDAAFATIGRERPDALFVGGDSLLVSRRVQLTQLAAHRSMPATYGVRDFVTAGGLMSYGPNIVDTYRQLGVYVGRLLKGVKPADLPVEQASKFELVINHQTARMLELTVPPTLLATADEVIE